MSEEPIGVAQARYLAGSHHRLGYAYPDMPRLDALAQPRLDGVRQVCAELGLPEPDVRTIPLEPDNAVASVKAWLAAEPPVTAICAFNDDIALAVLVALRSLGLRAPDDLAVIGVDDIPGAATAQPPLTTIVRDIDAIARGPARRIFDALDGKQISTDPVQDPLRVHVRESA